MKKLSYKDMVAGNELPLGQEKMFIIYAPRLFKIFKYRIHRSLDRNR